MMRRILWVGLMLFTAGCAMAPQAPVDTTGPANPQPATPAAVSKRVPVPAADAGSTTSVPVEPVPAPAVRQHVSLEDFAQANDDRLLQVYVGMSLRRVERIMEGQQSGSYVNPYRRQQLTGADGKVHEVFFYLTRPPRAGRRITETDLTPVIFQESRVVAIGRYPLKKLRRSLCQQRSLASCP